MKRFFDFILLPIRSIIRLFRGDSEEQWMGVVFSVLFLAIVFIGVYVGRFAIASIVKTSISEGVVVRKWYQEQYRQWTGKTYITIPESWHVVILGTNRFGKSIERDYYVKPEDFFRMETNTYWVFP